MAYSLLRKTKDGYDVSPDLYGSASLNQCADAIVKKLHGQKKITAFISHDSDDPTHRFLAVDTHPNEAWGEHMNYRQIIGTFTAAELKQIILTYAPML